MSAVTTGMGTFLKTVTRSVTKTPRDTATLATTGATPAPVASARNVTGETRHTIWDRGSGAHNLEVAGSKSCPAIAWRFLSLRPVGWMRQSQSWSRYWLNALGSSAA